MGLTAGGDGNNGRDCEGNRNNTSLNLGAGTGTGMNSWEQEGMASKIHYRSSLIPIKTTRWRLCNAQTCKFVTEI